jgi:hypothetical protein
MTHCQRRLGGLKWTNSSFSPVVVWKLVLVVELILKGFLHFLHAWLSSRYVMSIQAFSVACDWKKANVSLTHNKVGSLPSNKSRVNKMFQKVLWLHLISINDNGKARSHAYYLHHLQGFLLWVCTPLPMVCMFGLVEKKPVLSTPLFTCLLMITTAQSDSMVSFFLTGSETDGHKYHVGAKWGEEK